MSIKMKLTLVLIHLQKKKTAPLSDDEYDCSNKSDSFKEETYKGNF